MQNEKKPEQPAVLERALPHLILIAGMFMPALLVIGLFSPLNGPAFQYTFLAHCVFFSLATVVSLAVFLKFAVRAKATPLLWLPPVLFFLAIMVIEGLAPVTSRDALIHHMAVPKWWLNAGRIVPISWHDWSYYPMLVDLGYCGLMTMGQERLCALYHGAHLVLMCGLVSSWIYSRTKDADTSCFAFLAGLSMPVCLRLGSEPLVDLGLGLYVFLALYYALRWSESGGPIVVISLSGTSLGLALGCKYNGLLAAVLFIPMLIVLGKRSGLSDTRVLFGMIFCGLFAFMLFSPWLAKNILWTGNPLYPLYKNYLGNVETLPKVEMPHGLAPLEHRMLIYGDTPLDILFTPIKMVFFGEDNNPARFDGVLTPVVLLAIITIARMRRESWVTFATLFSAFYFCFAILMAAPRTRYLSPVFGSVLALSSYGLFLLLVRFPRWSRAIFGSVLFLHLAVASAYSLSLVTDSRALALFLGKISREDYLKGHILEYPAIKFINEDLKEPGKIYLLFTANRFYYFDRPILSSGHYSDLFIRQLAYGGTPELLARELLNRDIRFIFENSERRLSSFKEDEPDISDNERAFRRLYRDFNAKYLKMRYQFGQYALWQVIAPPENHTPH